MGLTSEADLVDLRAMDTAEDVILRFVRHEMHYPNNSSGRLRLLLQYRLKYRNADLIEPAKPWPDQFAETPL
jgi:hypothetical protein